MKVCANQVYVSLSDTVLHFDRHTLTVGDVLVSEEVQRGGHQLVMAPPYSWMACRVLHALL